MASFFSLLTGRFIRLGPALALGIFLSPILAGLVGTSLSAFSVHVGLGRLEPDWAQFQRFFAYPGIYKVLFFTLWIGFSTTLLALVLCHVTLAYLYGTRLMAFLRWFLAPVLAVPHSALAIGLAFVLAPSGWLMRLAYPVSGLTQVPDYDLAQGGLSMIFLICLKEFFFLLLLALGFLKNLEADRMILIARTMGYTSSRAYFLVVMPRLGGLLRLPVLAVLSYGLSVVDVVLILGPHAPPTLSRLILRWYNDPDLNFQLLAACGSLVQFFLTLGSILFWLWVGRVLSRLSRPLLIRSGRGLRALWSSALSGGLVVGMLLVWGFSFLSLLIWSLAGRWRYPDVLPTAWSYQHWRWSAFPDLVYNSALIGMMMLVLCLIVALACLENEVRHRPDPLRYALWILYLPLLTPQISFLFGFQILLLFLRLDSTLGAVVFAHMVYVLPYLFLSLQEAWRRFDPRYRLTALTLGAGPNRILCRVTIPILLRPILIACAIGFSVSIALYLPTLMLSGGKISTLTTEAVTLSSGGNRRVVSVVALWQAILPLLGFGLALLVPAILYRRRELL